MTHECGSCDDSGCTGRCRAARPSDLWRDMVRAGFGRPAHWPKPVCNNLGCGVLSACARADCPGKQKEAPDAP